MNKKTIIIISVVVLLLVTSIFFFTGSSGQNKMAPENNLQNNQAQNENVLPPLNTQADFKLVGTKIVEGGGDEPGFNFVMTQVNDKILTELISSYGETRYVGYLAFTGQATSSKEVSGPMLNKENVIVNAKFEVSEKQCTVPSGDIVPLTVKISVGEEELKGCASMF